MTSGKVLGLVSRTMVLLLILGSSGYAGGIKQDTQLRESQNYKISLEERVAKMEGTLEQMSDRLNHIESDIRELRGQMNANTNELRDRIDSNFKWTLGILISMWVTIILAIIFKRS